MKQTNKIIACALAFVLVFSMIPMIRAADHPFTDVPGGAWYEQPVIYCYQNGLISGMNETTFGPNVNMSRAMLVTVLYSMEGKPAVEGASPFSDVPDSKWYYHPILWAYSNGIVSGTSDTTFAPDANITREQMVAIFCKYAQYKGLDTSASADLSGYADQGDIASYFVNAFKWAVAETLVSGMDTTHLGPKGTATRAQCATILRKFHLMLPEAQQPEPTEAPAEVPTEAPTEAPTAMPTEAPTEPPASVQVAEEADYSSYGDQLPAYCLQDIRYWGIGTLKRAPLEMGSYRVYNYRDAGDYIADYVAMLQENGWTLVDEYSSSGYVYTSLYSYSLICDAATEVETRESLYNDVPCHVDIWLDDLTWRFDVVNGITVCDLGLRQDGSEGQLLPQGESVASGLIRNADGSYSTTDGRLTTSVGSAMVIRDGEILTGAVEWTRKEDVLSLKVNDYYRNEYVRVEFDGGTLAAGDIFRRQEIEDPDTMPDLAFNGMKFSWESMILDYVSVRVMYYDENGDAVFYIYVQPDPALTIDGNEQPDAVEALVAVRVGPYEEP